MDEKKRIHCAHLSSNAAQKEILKSIKLQNKQISTKKKHPDGCTYVMLCA